MSSRRNRQKQQQLLGSGYSSQTYERYCIYGLMDNNKPPMLASDINLKQLKPSKITVPDDHGHPPVLERTGAESSPSVPTEITTTNASGDTHFKQ
ncbi:hypothetical protein J6590_021480 [Homalodisca vitripennis]|nr:hypothetical protein J6590_021480 [Homalodisca vitripennis]